MFNKKSNFKKVKLFRSKKSRNRRNSRVKLFSLLFVFLFLIPWILFGAWFYHNVWIWIPNIDEIEEIQFSETTQITDRNWVVLYDLFEENRSYVNFDEISEDMVNAIIAIEDQNFWHNPWIDIRWIVRAGVHDIVHLGEDLHWGSTITQQLIKNLLLTPEQTIQRKMQEIVLAIKLNWYLKDQIQQSHWQIWEDVLERKMKERILELYLNYVFLGNNSYWVEAATQTYFWKTANELNELESAIIASLPRSPSKINPYNNTHILMWQIIVENEDNEPIMLEEDIKKAAIEWIEEVLYDQNAQFQRDTSRLIGFLNWLLDFQIEHEWKNYNIQYNLWRKDMVLIRMYSDGYIDQETLKENIIKWLDYEFQRQTMDIKAPHFVFEVIRQLQQTYSTEILKRWWLTIRTSLDYEVQQKAKQAIKNNMEHVNNSWWNNSSMIYVDTENWDILAYVWSSDYYNQDIDWNVDMIQSSRQPGSALKPLVYAQWFQEMEITPDTPIYDIPFQIWNDNPVNADWQFLWLMPIKEALAHSRNIPAIKMYFNVWQEDSVKNFFNELWFTTFKDDVDYWYPIVIWWGEVKMLELARAYSHLTVHGQPAKVNPILDIKWANWSILYRKTIERKDSVISPGVAYLMWEILSDLGNMPPSWRNNFTFDWIDFGIKTGTSNIRTRDWRRLPRDWWLVSYTPSKVAAFWWWNTRGEALDPWTFGGWLLSWAWKEFFEKMLEEWKISNERFVPAQIRNISISEISWKRATNDTPSAFIQTTPWYINNLPSENDESIQTIQVDSMCDWAVSEFTPTSAIKTAYVIEPNTIMPNKRDKDDIIQRRQNTWKSTYEGKIWAPIFLEEPTQICEERKLIEQEWGISLRLIAPEEGQDVSRNLGLWYNISSPFDIENITVNIWNNELFSKQYSRANVSDITNVEIPSSINYWSHELLVKAVDSEGYSDTKKINVNLVEENDSTPYLEQNRSRAIENDDWSYTYTLIFTDDLSYVVSGKIFYDWEVISEFDSNVVNFQVESNENLRYEIEDVDWNIWKWSIDI